jgi:hypothetical protein
MFIVRTLSLSSPKDAHAFQLMEIEMPGLGGNDGRTNEQHPTAVLTPGDFSHMGLRW